MPRSTIRQASGTDGATGTASARTSDLIHLLGTKSRSVIGWLTLSYLPFALRARVGALGNPEPWNGLPRVRCSFSNGKWVGGAIGLAMAFSGQSVLSLVGQQLVVSGWFRDPHRGRSEQTAGVLTL